MPLSNYQMAIAMNYMRSTSARKKSFSWFMFVNQNVAKHNG